MILSNFGSAVLKSDLDFDNWCLNNGLSKLKNKIHYASEPKNEHAVYDALVAKGYKVRKTLFSVNDKNQYTYTVPRTQEEKEAYWQHEINFRYLYIAKWMGSIDAAEYWVQETYSNPPRSRVEEYEFIKSHKPTIPHCAVGCQCCLFCPWYNASGCQLSDTEDQKIKEFMEYYKKGK